MSGGYWNRVLRIDLSSRRVHKEEVSEDTWHLCVGGAGFGAKVLLDETDANTDPLGPENVLVFALGPYQSGRNPGNAKWAVVAKSPLTGTYGDSAAGGSWGLALKRAGYDALIVTGKAEKPVILKILDDNVQIQDADHLWGLDSYETVEAVKKATTNDSSVVSIGPAGEHLVHFACIVADKRSFAGRCGLGAVMGSKNLKAISVKGSGNVALCDTEKTMEEASVLYKDIYRRTKDGFRIHGTPDLCITAESLGDMPIRYWTGDVWPEGARKLGAPNYTEVLHATPFPCKNCPIGCHRNISLKEKPYIVEGPGPEYETLALLGTNLLIDDLGAIAKGNDICNRLGIDTITAGACVGLAMLCTERGWLTRKNSGIDLRWGNATAMIELVEQIGMQRGFGKLFTKGALAAAREIHPDAEPLVAHVKALDFPGHDPRSCWSLAINYATCTRGACHVRGVTEDVEMGGFVVPEIGIDENWTHFFSWKHQAELAVIMQNLCALLNSLVICLFMLDGGGMSFQDLLNLLNLTTGWDMTVEAAMRCGERVHNMQRLVNLRDGHRRETDVLPRAMSIPASEGFRANKTPTPLEPQIQRYYQIRNWDENGIPTLECLEKLGLLQLWEEAKGI